MRQTGSSMRVRLTYYLVRLLLSHGWLIRGKLVANTKILITLCRIIDTNYEQFY